MSGLDIPLPPPGELPAKKKPIKIIRKRSSDFHQASAPETNPSLKEENGGCSYEKRSRSENYTSSESQAVDCEKRKVDLKPSDCHSYSESGPVKSEKCKAESKHSHSSHSRNTDSKKAEAAMKEQTSRVVDELFREFLAHKMEVVDKDHHKKSSSKSERKSGSSSKSKSSRKTDSKHKSEKIEKRKSSHGSSYEIKSSSRKSDPVVKTESHTHIKKEKPDSFSQINEPIIKTDIHIKQEKPDTFTPKNEPIIKTEYIHIKTEKTDSFTSKSSTVVTTDGKNDTEKSKEMEKPRDLDDKKDGSMAKKSGTKLALGIKISSVSAELISSGVKIENDPEKNLEEGEITSDSGDSSDDDSSDDDDKDGEAIGSVTDGDGKSKSKKKKKKGKHKKKKKHKSKDKETSKHKHSHRSRSSSPHKHSHSPSSKKKVFDEDKGTWKSRSRSRSKTREKDKDSSRTRHRSRSRSRERDRDHDRHRHRSRSHDRDRGRDYNRYRQRSRSRDRDNRYRGRLYSRDKRSRSRSHEREKKPIRDLRSKIDKAKLREIAIANAYANMQTGQGPTMNLKPDEVAAIKAGGKSVEELTDFCKRIAENEVKDSSSDSDDDRRRPDSDEDPDGPFIHHPFKVKELPASIVMNIRNAKQLAILTPQEKAAQASTLRLQFPVSSGSHHRAKEDEWVPVEKTQLTALTLTTTETGAIVPVTRAITYPVPTATTTTALATTGFGAAAELTADAGQGADAAVISEDKVFPDPPPEPIDIGAVVSERLKAVRKLQDNPHDVQAMGEMYNVQKKMNQWAQSKQMPGQFTGTTGASVLTQQELVGDPKRQAWLKKVRSLMGHN